MPTKNSVRNPKRITMILTAITVILAIVAVLIANQLRNLNDVRPGDGQASTSCTGTGQSSIKFEGSDIGKTNVSKTLAGFTITLTNFNRKDGKDIVGFTFTRSGEGQTGQMTYFVKASTNKYGPNEVTGGGTYQSTPNNKAISHIEFCFKPGAASTSTPSACTSTSVTAEELEKAGSKITEQNGKIVFNIVNPDNCPVDVAALIYKKTSSAIPGLKGQKLFKKELVTVNAKSSKEVRLDSPLCYYQADLVTGHTNIIEEFLNDDSFYSPLKRLIASKHGGNNSCGTGSTSGTPTPMITNTPSPTPTVTITTTVTNTPTMSPTTVTTIVPVSTARCESLVIEPTSYVRNSTPSIKVTTKGTNNANYKYKVEVSGGLNTANYNSEFSITKTNISSTVTDTFGPLSPLVQTDLTQPATYTVVIVDLNGSVAMSNLQGCTKSFTIQPLIPDARCENVSVTAGPYTAGSKPVITVNTKGNNEADYTFKVELKGDANTGNYVFSSNKNKTNVTSSVSDAFTPTDGLVQTDVSQPAVYTVTVTDARTASDNTSVTNTSVCQASFTMPKQGYSIIKQAVSSDNLSTVSTIGQGASFKYIITVNNTEITPVSNITVVDSLDTAYAAKLTTSNISDSGSRVGNVITWTGVNVAANASKTLSFDVMVNSDFFTGLSQCSQLVGNKVSSTTPINVPENNIDITVINTACKEEYKVVKEVTPGTTTTSGTFTYTFQFSNTGDKQTQLVRLVDYFPAGFTYNGPSTFTRPDGSTFTKEPVQESGKLIWQFAVPEAISVNPGQNVVVAYSMKPGNIEGAFTNTACVEVPNTGCDDAVAIVSNSSPLPNSGIIEEIGSNNTLRNLGIALIIAALPVYFVVNRLKFNYFGVRRKNMSNSEANNKINEIISKIKK